MFENGQTSILYYLYYSMPISASRVVGLVHSIDKGHEKYERYILYILYTSSPCMESTPHGGYLVM